MNLPILEKFFLKHESDTRIEINNIIYKNEFSPSLEKIDKILKLSYVIESITQNIMSIYQYNSNFEQSIN